MKYLRWLLFPFSLLYGLVVIIRNWCYDAGFFKSYKFHKPVISIGNLDVGGAGKSPATEYLIRLLKPDYKVATLSRGYGRMTKGYIVAGEESQESGVKGQESRVESPESRVESQESRVKNQDRKWAAHLSLTTVPSQSLAPQIGDEPAQFKQKFPDITVAVCEKRVDGLKHLLPDHDVIILDDAFQHRQVEAGLSILLFDYNRVGEPHLLLPAGNLREPFSGRWRAQILVITKCPASLTVDERAALAQKVQPLPYQRLFFSTIAYQPLQYLDGRPAGIALDGNTTIFLLTGIAASGPLVQYLNTKTTHIVHHNYPDHHPFTLKNIAKLAAEFNACTSSDKIIITTEKDAQRLGEPWLRGAAGLTVFVMPIKMEFLHGGGETFNQLITDYVREHTAYNRVR